MLIGAGYSVDFVGSQHNGSLEDFDHDHEGHSGWRAEEIRDNITGWLNSTPADVILLHIGTNDISNNQGAASTAAEIGQILDRIDDWESINNGVWVVLARIINRNDSLSGITTTLNGLIQNLADTRIADGDRIIVVDMESALIYPDDLYDIVHPNNTGYGKMAAAWFAVLEGLLISLPNPDITPDQFTFTDQTGVTRNTAITSNIITVTGINAATPISVAGGTYSINGGPYTSANGIVINGNTVTVRQISSPNYYTITNATLTVGGVFDTFSVTTEAAPPDITPDQFTFTDRTGVTRNTAITSNIITVTGINAATPISVAGGTYSINGGPYTSANGIVINGNTVTVRQISSPNYYTITNATLTVGGVFDTFSVTTEAAPPDITPDQFTFTDRTGVTRNTAITSNIITVTGINAATPISVAGGTYSINGGPYTSANGIVINGNTVTVRQISSPNYYTITNATLTVGGVSDTFSVTTEAAPPDMTPDQFTFTDRTGVALNTVITSNIITVTGIHAATPISVAGGTYSINGGPYTSANGT